MKRIVYTRPDGGISVVLPVINQDESKMTEADAEQRAWSRLPSDAINPRWADPSEIPPDRYFRNAWHDAGVIAIDMVKATEIHKDKLRELRAPLLADLDVQFMKALETGDTKAQADIVAKKQVLRDLTADPAIAQATTPEQLKTAGLTVIADAIDAAVAAPAVPVKG